MGTEYKVVNKDVCGRYCTTSGSSLSSSPAAPSARQRTEGEEGKNPLFLLNAPYKRARTGQQKKFDVGVATSSAFVSLMQLPPLRLVDRNQGIALAA
jgi:hypothetical protein